MVAVLRHAPLAPASGAFHSAPAVFGSAFAAVLRQEASGRVSAMPTRHGLMRLSRVAVAVAVAVLSITKGGRMK